MIAAERLREILQYDPCTGIFVWRKKIAPKVVVGRVAGSRNSDGYICISMYGKRYYAHRLAWLYMTGEWPVLVDHADLNTSNNQWANLRAATKSQNARNTKRRATNTSEHKGVYFHKRAEKWAAQVILDGTHKYLGLFENKDDASAAYRAAIEADRFARDQ